MIKQKNIKIKKRDKKYIIETDDDNKVAENEEQSNELEEYSKKRNERLQKKRRRRKRIIILFLLAFIVLFIYVNWGSIAPSKVAENIKTFMSGFGVSKYPVDIEDGTLSTAVPVGSNIGVLTDTSFIVYSKNGDKVDTRPHGINNPTAVFGGSKALIFDRGGKSFKVESRSSEEFSANADFNITSASMASNGSFAVVTESDNYLSEVKIYNGSYQKIFKWDCVGGRILATALNGNNFAAIVVGVRDGNMFSDVYIYDISSEKPKTIKKYDDTLLYSINFSDSSHICAVGDKKAVFLGTDGTQISAFDYSEKELAGASNISDTPTFAFKKGTSQTELYTFDASGKQKGTKTFPASSIKSLYNGSGKTVLISGDELWYFNNDCSNGSHIALSGDTKSVLSLNNSAYIFKTQSIEMKSIK